METSTCLEDLCEDLIASILCCISLKPRTKLKCVCKSWCSIITRLRQSNPPTTSSGFVGTLHPALLGTETYQATLHTDQDQGKECILENVHAVSYADPILLGSCKGLLLYATDASQPDGMVLGVSNPILKQFITLPLLPYRLAKGFVCASIFFEGSIEHFRVMCNFWDKLNPTTIKCCVFNPEIGEWGEHEARIVNPSVIPKQGLSMGVPYCHLSNGKLYNRKMWWVMLVYNFERQVFKVVQLPNFTEYQYLRMWESDGCLYYCQSTYDRMNIWTYVDDDDDDECTDVNLNWVLKKSIAREELYFPTSEDDEQDNDDDDDDVEEEEEEEEGSGNEDDDDDDDDHDHDHEDEEERGGGGEEVGGNDDEPLQNRMRSIPFPLGFNDDLQILYTRLNEIICSYSFETRRSTEVLIQPPVFNDGSKTLDLQISIVLPYDFENGRKAKLRS